MRSGVAQSLLANPVLSGGETSKLISAVGPLKEGFKREMLEIGVHNAALAFAMKQERQPIAPQDRAKDAHALADACRMVLVRLGLTVESRRKDKTARKPVEWRSLKRSLGPGALYTGGGSVLAAISAVQELERMAENIAAHYTAKSPGKVGAKKGAPKNLALGPLFRDLEWLYVHAWDEIPSLVRSSTQGEWREADGADGVIADAYAKGDEFPVRFLRFLSELFPLFARRGMDVPISSVAIEQACRRWRKEQRDLAAKGEADESLYDLVKRLSKGLPLG